MQTRSRMAGWFGAKAEEWKGARVLAAAVPLIASLATTDALALDNKTVSASICRTDWPQSAVTYGGSGYIKAKIDEPLGGVEVHCPLLRDTRDPPDALSVRLNVAGPQPVNCWVLSFSPGGRVPQDSVPVSSPSGVTGFTSVSVPLDDFDPGPRDSVSVVCGLRQGDAVYGFKWSE